MLARDSNNPLPCTALLQTCKQLHDEATEVIAKSFAFVHVDMTDEPELASILVERVKAAVIMSTSELGHYLTKVGRCAMHLRIGAERIESSVTNIMLSDAGALWDFLEALVTFPGRYISSYRLWNDFVACDLRYRIEFTQSARSTKQRRRQETLLLQPFFDLFWNEFYHVSIVGAMDETRRDRLLERMRMQKWSSAEEFIDSLKRAILSGRVAYQQGNYRTAYSLWRQARHELTLTGYNSQPDLLDHHETPIKKICFQLYGYLAAVYLEFAMDPQLGSIVHHYDLELLDDRYRCCSQRVACPDSTAHRDQLRFAAMAYEYCLSASACMASYRPTELQLSNLHHRRAQALRLRACLRGNLQAAEKAICQAINLCSVDAWLHIERQKIQDMIRVEVKMGTVEFEDEGCCIGTGRETECVRCWSAS